MSAGRARIGRATWWLVALGVALRIGRYAMHYPLWWDEAFLAARRLIDDVKATVPIWKHQLFTDGTEEWVGTP